MYHAKKIGVFISHIFGTYQQGVCQGIIDKALEYGYTAEIFTSLDGENLGAYEAGEESILRIPNYDSFDGIIFASDTYISSELKQKILRKLQTLSCPIVEIAVADNHFPTVSLENNSMAGEMATHFLTVHHASRVCYLGCQTEAAFPLCGRTTIKRHWQKPGKLRVNMIFISAATTSTPSTKRLLSSVRTERRKQSSVTMTVWRYCFLPPHLQRDIGFRKTSRLPAATIHRKDTALLQCSPRSPFPYMNLEPKPPRTC